MQVSANSATNVQLTGMVKNIGRTEVLKGVDLEVPAGEFMVILGPSGCGKTTLLRIIAGLEHPTHGEVLFSGERVTDLEPKERNIAMVFQNYALYPHMTAYENQAFSLKIARNAKSAIADAVNRTSEMLGLEQLLARLPRELSGGQRQRVAMGRAIVRSPRVFLFDEPLSNLDAKLRVQMRVEIKDLHKNLGATSIYVTHDQVEAMTMADRIVVMNAGRIEQVGTPLEVFDKPANRFVAGFTGSPAMNFVSASVEANGAGVLARVAQDQAIPLQEGFGGQQGRSILVGVRPHQLTVSESGALHAEVKSVQPTGVETIIVCDADGRELVLQSLERVNLREGERISLTAKPEDVHLFDAETGARLEA